MRELSPLVASRWPATLSIVFDQVNEFSMYRPWRNLRSTFTCREW